MHSLLKLLYQRKYQSKSCPTLKDESWRLKGLANKERMSSGMLCFFLKQRCFSSPNQSASDFSESEYPKTIHLFSQISDFCCSILSSFFLSLVGFLSTAVSISFIQVSLSLKDASHVHGWLGRYIPIYLLVTFLIFSFRTLSSAFLNPAIQRIVSVSCSFIVYLDRRYRNIHCFVQSFSLSGCRRLLDHQRVFPFYNYFGYSYPSLSLEIALTESVLVKDLLPHSLPAIQPVQKKIHITDEECDQFLFFLKRRKEIATYFSYYCIVSNPWCANKFVGLGKERMTTKLIN